MLRKHAVLLSVVGLSLAAAPASAQTMGQLQWVGTGSSFAATYLRQNNTQTTVYAGAAYRANALLPGTAPWYLQNSNGFGPAVDIYCIDFVHAANTSTYAAWFTNLGYDALTRTRGGDLDRYRQVAWLSDQMDLRSVGTAAGRQERAEIHAAIWQVMNGTTQPVAARTGSYAFNAASVSNWVQLAGTGANSVDLRNWTVVTSDCVSQVGNAGDGHLVADNCGQEFMVREGTVTPEPMTLVLMATGLLALAGAAFVTRGGMV